MSIYSSPTQKGQGLVEYALILVLVSMVAIGALTLLGPSVSTVYAKVNELFPGVASLPEPTAEPTPAPTEEPFGYASAPEAKAAFCTTYTGTGHFHIHGNSATGVFIGFPNMTPLLPGFTLGPQEFCP